MIELSRAELVGKSRNTNAISDGSIDLRIEIDG